MAPRHHPHDRRFAIAIAPRAITRMMAMGVSQASRLVCNAVAPVMNGELCACEIEIGATQTRTIAGMLEVSR
jgi:hypothetical protein